jgi:hypothetical protein
MENSGKRVDRPTFWKWAVPLVLGHVLLSVLAMNGLSKIGFIDTVIIVFLARTLAWRFRDIGWPVWIGPTILIGTMLVLPLLVVGYAIANNAGDDITQWFSLVGLISGPVNLILLIVAGSVPGKPTVGGEVAQVFE